MSALTKIRIFPTGMRLHEWIAFEEGYFRAEGLDPEVMWDVYLGQMKAWSGGYKLRPQVMAAINRWGMGREMQITEFDRLALSLA